MYVCMYVCILTDRQIDRQRQTDNSKYLNNLSDLYQNEEGKTTQENKPFGKKNGCDVTEMRWNYFFVKQDEEHY